MILDEGEGEIYDKDIPQRNNRRKRIAIANSLKEFAKIKGIQVATEISGEVMGTQVRMTTEVVEISQKDAPRGIYEIPLGFTKKATLSLEDFQRR